MQQQRGNSPHDDTNVVVVDKPVDIDLFKSMIHALNEFTIWFGEFIQYIDDKNEGSDDVSN